MTVRLPAFGGEGIGDAGAGDRLVPAAEPRAAPRVLAVVGATRTAAAGSFAEAAVRAWVAEGARPSVIVAVRTPERCEVERAQSPDRWLEAGAGVVLRVRAGADRAGEALERAFALVDRVAPIVTIGADVPALYRPRLAVLVSGGVAPLGWAPEVRALDGRFDVELCDVRPDFALELIRRWQARDLGAPPP